MKTCNTCKIPKDDSEFNKNGLYLRADCKVCHSKKCSLNQSKKDLVQYKKDYYSENKDTILKEAKKYRTVNKTRLNQSRKGKYTKYHREYAAKKRKADPIFRMKHSLRSSIRSGFKRLNHDKSCHTIEALGCSFDDFRKYIESKWQKWMTWKNYGRYNGKYRYGWDLDHIIPLSVAKDIDELIKLSHYTNFQPLCSYKNRVSKRAKYEN